MARRAHSVGFLSVWSPPPPRAATFEVPPGGTAIFVRKPHAVRELRAPELQRWHELGRLTTALLVLEKRTYAICVVYAFPVSHPMHGANEEMFAHIYAWAMSLRHSVIIGGDMNETTKTSQFLSLSLTLQASTGCRLTSQPPGKGPGGLLPT